jgi:hypothetical protein
MRVRLPNWISALEGWNNGLVFYGYREKYGMCYARDYVYPTITSENTAFGTKAKAITDTTWNSADSSFVSDMQLYADAWNETQQAGRELARDMTAINLFVKACFAAAAAVSYDLADLTCGTFGGEVGDLLGTEAPNVGNLVTQAGLPSCGLDLTTLSSPIIAA